MNEDLYLISLALIEQGGHRLLPLGGKSIKKSIDIKKLPEEIAKELVHQILLRVFQKSDGNPIHRANGDESLIIIKIPMDAMQETIPLLKAEWIKTGNSIHLISELNKVCKGIWSVLYDKAKGTHFIKLGEHL